MHRTAGMGAVDSAMARRQQSTRLLNKHIPNTKSAMISADMLQTREVRQLHFWVVKSLHAHPLLGFPTCTRSPNFACPPTSHLCLLPTCAFCRLGTKGNKIDVELAPMAEAKLEEGQIPGASPETTVAADGFVSGGRGYGFLQGPSRACRAVPAPLTWTTTPPGDSAQWGGGFRGVGSQSRGLDSIYLGSLDPLRFATSNRI